MAESQSGGARRELGRDLVRYLPSQLIPAIIGIFTIPILTRLFAPAEYGDYRLVLTTVGAFGAAGSWLAAAVYRFLPEEELLGRLENFRTTVTRLLVVNSAVLAATWAIGVFFLRPLLGDDLVGLFLLGLLLMIANGVWSQVSAQARAVREVTWYSTGAVLNRALTLGGGVALVTIFGFGVEGLLYGSIAGSLLLLPLLIRVVRKRMPAGPGRFDRVLGRAMFRYGWPLTFTSVASWLLELGDRYIIAAFRGTAEVGLYSAAYGISTQAMQVLLLMFKMPFTVLGSRVWERDGEESAAAFVASSARSYLLITIPAWVGLSVLAYPIMTVMTDAPYRSAFVIIPVVSGALLLDGVYFWYKSASTFTKETSRQAVALVWGVAINFALNLLLVGRFGYRAAAVTTLVSYAASLVIIARWSRRQFRWPFPWVSVGRAVVASGVMAAALLILDLSTDFGVALQLGISIPMGAAVYGAVLVLMREAEAVKMMRRLTSRVRKG